MERERRVTAGKRMTALVGKALEDDEAFWGHDTWNDDDEENESFHSSDEDSVLRRDEFDSDFNDSETDHEEEEQERGMQEEIDLQRQEKRQLKKSNYVDLASKASRASAMKKQKGKKSVTGEGLNAGIVLNLPTLGPRPVSTLIASKSDVGATPAKPGTPPAELVRSPIKSDPVRTSARTRQRRLPTKSRRSVPHQHRQSQRMIASMQTLSSSSVRKDRHQYTQEELLLEAVHETEPSNERWLLTRKRQMQDVEESQHRVDRLHQHHKGRVIERYVSRRGYLNVVSFPEMEHVPHVLTQKTMTSPPDPTYCIVTGKRARYRDPQTGHGYYDASAFKEIRRRTLDQGNVTASPSVQDVSLNVEPFHSAGPNVSMSMLSESHDLPSSQTNVATSALRADTEEPTAPKYATSAGMQNLSTSSILRPEGRSIPSPGVVAANPSLSRTQIPETLSSTDMKGADMVLPSLGKSLSEEIKSGQKQHDTNAIAHTTHQVQLPNKPFPEKLWTCEETTLEAESQESMVQDLAHLHAESVVQERSSLSLPGEASLFISVPAIPVTMVHAEPPPSPRRSSPRRQKPSAKILENTATHA